VVIALELNLFKEHGVEVDAKRFPAGKDARDAVVANTRDIATVSGTPCEPFCALAESTLGMLARMGVNPKYISALDKYFQTEEDDLGKAGRLPGGKDIDWSRVLIADFLPK